MFFRKCDQVYNWAADIAPDELRFATFEFSAKGLQFLRALYDRADSANGFPIVALRGLWQRLAELPEPSWQVREKNIFFHALFANVFSKWTGGVSVVRRGERGGDGGNAQFRN
jgi:hypothetical protein